jgi:hypothetical protein
LSSGFKKEAGVEKPDNCPVLCEFAEIMDEVLDHQDAAEDQAIVLARLQAKIIASLARNDRVKAAQYCRHAEAIARAAAIQLEIAIATERGARRILTPATVELHKHVQVREKSSKLRHYHARNQL